MDEKIEEKTNTFFAKEFSFSFKALDNTLELFDSVREFCHHISEAHYYSETINKKIFAMTLDVHLLSLQLPLLQKQARELYSEAEIAIDAGKTPTIQKKSIDELKIQLQTVDKKINELNTSLQKLVSDIKIEANGKV
ncbi:MAG: hypothetical protein V1722_00905 [Candidatus Micrarchaeota archaeon]